MKIQKFIANYFHKRVSDAPTLVIYDPDQRYRTIVEGMGNDKVKIIDVSKSTIVGREQAVEAWKELALPGNEDKRLVIYLPIVPPNNEMARQSNPYEIFALGGSFFPEGDGESYQALCRQAAPDQAEGIDRLFNAGVPDFETINNLIPAKASWPKLRAILHAESAAEIMAGFLCPNPDPAQALQQDDTWVPEFKGFIKNVLGMDLKTKSKKPDLIREEVWRYLLFSEFAFDLPVPLPERLEHVPRADNTAKDLVYHLCDQFRQSEKYQTVYMNEAEKVAQELQLEHHLSRVTNLGVRDTFAFQERTFLLRFQEAVLSEKFDEASEIVESRRDSIWVKHLGERQGLWTIAERSIQLLVMIDDLKPAISALPSNSTEAVFDFYVQRFQIADQKHRSFEQAVVDALGTCEELEKIIDLVRSRYLSAAESLQSIFIGAVQAQGWPVSGRLRSTEIFQNFIAPDLEGKKRVALFMVDALRYELAVQMESELSGRLKVSISPVSAQLPTITAVGMAALLPDANKSLELRIEKDAIIPYISENRISVPEERFNHLKTYYGDRCFMVDLDDIVTKPKKTQIPEKTSILLIKTSDIDQLGEIGSLEAKRLIPRFLQKIVSGINWVQKKGFDKVVIATDHGFIMMDEHMAGDQVEKPSGDWLVVKDRCLVGRGSSDPSVIAFRINEVGIDGDFDQYMVPRTFASFTKGKTYFHTGLSLQECVLPVVIVDLPSEVPKPEVSGNDLILSYKGGTTNKITTRRPMIEIVLHRRIFFDQEIEFVLQAVTGKSDVIGEPAECSYVDSATGFIKIQPGQAIKIPLKMSEQFSGQFEVRATDPRTGQQYGPALKLKTDYME